MVEARPLSCSLAPLEGAACPWRAMGGCEGVIVATSRLSPDHVYLRCSNNDQSGSPTSATSCARGASIPCGTRTLTLPTRSFVGATRKMDLPNEALYYGNNPTETHLSDNALSRLSIIASETRRRRPAPTPRPVTPRPARTDMCPERLHSSPPLRAPPSRPAGP